MKRTLLTSALLALHCGLSDAIDVNARELRSRNMKIGLPLFTTDLSGKLGGVVGTKARGGVRSFRTRVIPGNPQSAAQTKMRAILSGISGAWKSTLTDSQRAGWSAIANDNESGIDVYAASNSINMLSGHARVDDAPESKTLPWLTIPDLADHDQFTLVLDTGTLVFNSTANGSTYLTAASSRFLVYLEAGVQKPSRERQQYNFRFGSKATSAAGVISMVNDLDKFPELKNVAEGDKIWVRFQGVNNLGQVTSDVKALMTVDAA